MITIRKKLRLYGVHKKICFFLINHIFTGTKSFSCAAKRKLMQAVGNPVGKGTTIVGPITVLGTVSIGENCWINRGFTVHGNGHVSIGDNCDIAPNVTFLTGGHAIGDHARRAGAGETYRIQVGNGCWIGAGSTVLGNTTVEDGSVIAACACVNRDVPKDTLAGGVPAKIIRKLDDETVKPSEK
ncbi:MAG: transferase [Clostridia bacterium]|nr:transferase [Clostridia bacterium]